MSSVRWVAFLRGVNLGKRQMQMAELRACCESAGFTKVKTILASGNVRFEAESGDEDEVRMTLETALEADFAFPVKVVMRRTTDIESMIAAAPFADIDPGADVAFHVLLADRPMRPKPQDSIFPEHVEVPRVEARELYLAAHRLPNGRYTEGLEALGKALPKGLVVTMRNWNTILKVLT